MNNLIFQYPAWYVLLCILLGFLFAAGLYFRDRTFRNASEQSQKLLAGLAVFRFLSATIISILLLSPFLRKKSTETEQPVVVFLQDNSNSIGAELNADDSLQYAEQIKSVKSGLSGKYDVKFYTFGDKLKAGEPMDFKDKSTDISGALDEIYDQYTHQNLGAIILASDGIFNKGNNPVYSSQQLGAPVFTIALGDTTRHKDIKISRVYHNSIAYLGDRIEIKVDIEAYSGKGEDVVFSLQHIQPQGVKKIHEEIVAVDKDEILLTKSINIPLEETGVQQYRISVSPLENEKNLQNNTQSIFIDVLDSRQKILILANAPHPDISTLKSALEGNKNYEVTVKYAKEDIIATLPDYNLVILHQLPSKKYAVKPVLDEIRAKKIPSFYILGAKTDVQLFNTAQSLVKIDGYNGSYNDVQAIVDKGFTKFELTEDIISNLPKLPPLKVPFGMYAADARTSVVLKQKINMVETDYPLLLLSDEGETKQGIFLGEGIWRWKLYNYLNYKNQELISTLISKTVQFLSVKSDKRKFRIELPKKVFAENEPITFHAELYNENYELVHDPDVEISILNENKQEYPFNFDKSDQGYELDAGFFPSGNYTYKAQTTFNGKLFTASGQFNVKSINLESVNPVADHHLLYLLSKQNGGKLYYPNQLEGLKNDLLNQSEIKPVLHDIYKTTSIINLKWIFFIILAFLAVEWFIRKYNGAY
jgi:hypothetical protein